MVLNAACGIRNLTGTLRVSPAGGYNKNKMSAGHNHRWCMAAGQSHGMQTGLAAHVALAVADEDTLELRGRAANGA